PPIAILAVRARNGQPAPASLIATGAPATARVERAQPERLRIRVDASNAVTATVAVAWSPRWQARVDGRTVDLAPTNDGLIQVRLPPGRTRLDLAYEPDGWDRLGVAVSAGAGALLVGVGVWAPVGRRRAAPAGAAGGPARPT